MSKKKKDKKKLGKSNDISLDNSNVKVYGIPKLKIRQIETIYGFMPNSSFCKFDSEGDE